MAVSKEFVAAGNATFTIEVPADFADEHGYKPHYTYRVRQGKPSEQYPNPGFFIKLLAGPDNTSDYQYLGMLITATGKVKLTAASKLPEDSPPVKLLARVLAHVWADNHQAYEQHGFRTHHEGKCGCCGRKLTTPESIQTGIGPICAGRKDKAEAEESGFISDGLSIKGLKAIKDGEGDITHWEGVRKGKKITVWND